jgi:hypothetical protein
MGPERTGKLQATGDVLMVTVLDFTYGEFRGLIVPKRISRQRPPQKIRATHA